MKALWEDGEVMKFVSFPYGKNGGFGLHELKPPSAGGKENVFTCELLFSQKPKSLTMGP